MNFEVYTFVLSYDYYEFRMCSNVVLLVINALTRNIKPLTSKKMFFFTIYTSIFKTCICFGGCLYIKTPKCLFWWFGF